MECPGACVCSSCCWATRPRVARSGNGRSGREDHLKDLFFDRLSALLTSVAHAVRERPVGSTPIGALRDLVLTMLAERHPLSECANRGYTVFWRVMVEVDGADPHIAVTRFAAASAVAAYRTVLLAAAGRIMGGADPDAVVAELDVDYRRAFEAAERSAAAFGAIPPRPA